MSALAALPLPKPISAYFVADQQTAEAVARCFTAQAVVNDVGYVHTGTEEIKARKDMTLRFRLESGLVASMEITV
jgi:hypothetical protein